MNARTESALLARRDDAGAVQRVQRPADPPVQRTVWNAPYGPIVIEVVGDEVFVNGDKVQPAALSPSA